MDGQTQATTDYLSGFQYLDGKLDFIPHSEGYVKAVHTGETTEYHYVYNYTDHLGNIRLSYGRDPETDEVAILNENHYYPFGLKHKGYVSEHKIFNPIAGKGKVELVPVRNYLDDTYRYDFNAKEHQPELGLNWHDYHARNYDAALGRWMNVDPLAEKYSSIAPYVYVANNPVNAIDPDGRLIIFINGFHFGDGGRSEYWNGLDTRLQKRIGDKHARYYDGGLGGIFGSKSNLSAGVRRRAGKRMAYKQAAEILGSLDEGETIKIATHSMGGAYGKGFIQGLRKYAKKNDIDITDLIDFEVDLAPFQPGSQEAQEGIPTTVIAHEGDRVAGSNPVPGADNNVTRKGKKKSAKEHSVDSFTQKEIDELIPESKQTAVPKVNIYEQKPKRK